MFAYSGTLGELFENAAYGIAARAGFDADVKPLYDVPVMAIGDTPAELLAGWLSQLGNAGSDRGVAFGSFVVDHLELGGVQGAAAGYVSVRGGSSRASSRVETVVEAGGSFWARVRF